jgi:hypothetical protein
MGHDGFNYGVPEYGVKDIMESNYYQLEVIIRGSVLFYRSDGALSMSDILDEAL